MLATGGIALLVNGTAFAASSWGQAQIVPNSASLNAGGSAAVTSMSCPSSGNCLAGGYYHDSSMHRQAFVVEESNGVWGQVQEVPNTATLNVGGDAEVQSVSCASAGNCAAGGYYLDGSSHHQLFVVDETSGTWGQAQEVPNISVLNVGGDADLYSISCPAAGSCSAGGGYTDGSSVAQAFVVDETSGVWGQAQEVPNTSTLNVGLHASVLQVSCDAPGSCSASGGYIDGNSAYQVFVASEISGTWGNAEELPNIGTLNTGGLSAVSSMSCPAAGSCNLGGLYVDGSGGHAFVDSEVGGVWNSAETVPNILTLDVGNGSEITSVSCASSNDCVAGGQYVDASSHIQAFLVASSNGTWGQAEEVPNSAALNVGGNAQVTAVSCPSAGNCSAAGNYVSAPGVREGFVVDEVNGTWGNAEAIPNLSALNVHDLASVLAMSCGAAGNCAIGGSYRDGSQNTQAFLVNSAPAVVPTTTTPPTTAPVGPTTTTTTALPDTGSNIDGGLVASLGLIVFGSCILLVGRRKVRTSL